MGRFAAWLVLLALAPGLAGCPALATRQTADTVAPGKWQLSAGVDGAVFRDTEQETRIPTLMLDVGARHGVSQNVDIGARLYTFGLQMSGKWRAVDGPWRVALAPAGDFVRTRETSATVDSMHLFGHLPVIFGRDLSATVQVNFGPRGMYGYYLPRTGGEEHGWSVGAFGNLAIEMSDSWTLLPEMSLQRSVSGEVPVRGWVGQLGCGVLWNL